MELFFEDFLDDGRVRKVDVVSFDIVEDDVNFVYDFFTSSDRVKERFVEVVGCCVNELNKVVLGDPVYHIVGILLGDMHVIIFHFGASEYGHGADKGIGKILNNNSKRRNQISLV